MRCTCARAVIPTPTSEKHVPNGFLNDFRLDRLETDRDFTSSTTFIDVACRWSLSVGDVTNKPKYVSFCTFLIT